MKNLISKENTRIALKVETNIFQHLVAAGKMSRLTEELLAENSTNSRNVNCTERVLDLKSSPLSMS